MTTAGQAPGEGFTTAEDEWRSAVGAMHLGVAAAGTMNTPRKILRGIQAKKLTQRSGEESAGGLGRWNVPRVPC
jgi:hypothetical protein